MTVEVVCSDARPPMESTALPIDTERWRSLAAQTLESEGADGELTLTFVGVDEIAELNAEHMGVQGATDVLSFPLDDVPAERAPVGTAAVEGVPVLLGDVVISPAVAAAQFADHAGSLDDEIALLVVHGVLHILGHDHLAADEAARMRARERDLLVEHHWRGGPPAGFRYDHA